MKTHYATLILLALSFVPGGCVSLPKPHEGAVTCGHPFGGGAFVGACSFTAGDLHSREQGAVDMVFYFDNDDENSLK